jgi:hypothetical protein
VWLVGGIIFASHNKQITVDGVDAMLELNVSAGQEEYLALICQILRLREVYTPTHLSPSLMRQLANGFWLNTSRRPPLSLSLSLSLSLCV